MAVVFKNAVFVGGERVSQSFIEETVEAIHEIRTIMKPNESTSPLDISKALCEKGFCVYWERDNVVDGIEWKATIILPKGV